MLHLPQMQSQIPSVHYANFARGFLEELYGENEVAFFKKDDNIDEHTMCIGGLFSIRVGSDGEYHLYTSRQLGPDRNYSGVDLVHAPPGKSSSA